MNDVLRPLPVDEFVQLATSAGLEITEEDFDQLVRRRLIIPSDSNEYGRIHLYPLALYFEAVRVYRHPWAIRQSTRTLDEVKEQAATVAAVADELSSANGASAALSDLALEIERFLVTIDPFGPLSNVLDVTRPDVVTEMRGAGRLYAELRATATRLAATSEANEARSESSAPADVAEDDDDGEDARATREMDARQFASTDQQTYVRPAVAAQTAASDAAKEDSEPRGEVEPSEVSEASEPSEVSEASELSEVSEASEPSEVSEASEPSDVSEASEPSDVSEPSEADDDEQPGGGEDDSAEAAAGLEESSAEEPADTGEEEDDAVTEEADGPSPEDTAELETVEPQPEETLELDEDERQAIQARRAEDSGFSREESSTGRTRALLERLEEIKAQRSGDEPEKDVPADDPPSEPAADAGRSLEDKVNELNQLREQLIREQNWAGLVELYEERIDLFEEPADRQQVKLTLATLYELKLNDTSSALRRFHDAFSIDVEAGRIKTLDSLRKIGMRPNGAASWATWLEEHLAMATGDILKTMQRDLTVARKSSGSPQRAFRGYAKFLSESPGERVDTQSLDVLDELSLSVDDEELAQFFDGLLDLEETRSETRYLIALRAGMFYLGRNEPHHAMRCFRIALDADGSSEIAFSNLSRLYEKEENWGDLRSLIARKLASAEGEEADRLRRELGRVVENELSTEEAVAKFGHTLETDFNDEHALNRLVEAYVAMDRFPDAYAHLNRLLEKPLSSEQEVRVRKHLALIAAENLQAPEEAGHHFQLALEIAGPDRELLEGLASVRMNSGAWAEAIQALRMLTGGSVVMGGDRMKKWLNAGIEAARQAERPDDLKHFQERLAGMSSAS